MFYSPVHYGDIKGCVPDSSSESLDSYLIDGCLLIHSLYNLRFGTECCITCPCIALCVAIVLLALVLFGYTFRGTLKTAPFFHL